MDFGKTPTLIDYNRRIFLIGLYAWAGLVFLLPLGVTSLLSDRLTLGLVLIGNMMFALGLMAYSRVTRRVGGASLFFSVQAGLLGAYLAIFGGVEGSGVYFSFPLALVMIMLGFTSVRFGALLSVSFVAVVAIGLYGEVPGAYAYTAAHKARIVMALSALCVMSMISEWIRSKSYEAITDTAERLDVDATHDQLTGLLNRRGFESRVAEMAESDFPAVLGVIDIDEFKKINDVHGHDAGDEALKFMAEYLRGNVKGRDLMCRWGGEEFVVLFTHLSFHSGIVVLDQIRDEIGARPIRHGGISFTVTFSAGVVELDSKDAFGPGLKLADQRLYHAKQTGRNRIVSMLPD